ncbi:hypothetical protein LZ30DRAFT_379363 [Colletotrichum cereale]|nr:hypothetical protein LZ30DRAFT_379363 [Colletotrichum cereale]
MPVVERGKGEGELTSQTCSPTCWRQLLPQSHRPVCRGDRRRPCEPPIRQRRRRLMWRRDRARPGRGRRDHRARRIEVGRRTGAVRREEARVPAGCTAAGEGRASCLGCRGRSPADAVAADAAAGRPGRMSVVEVRRSRAVAEGGRYIRRPVGTGNATEGGSRRAVAAGPWYRSQHDVDPEEEDKEMSLLLHAYLCIAGLLGCVAAVLVVAVLLLVVSVAAAAAAATSVVIVRRHSGSGSSCRVEL